MKKYYPDKNDEATIQALKGRHLVVGFTNRFNEGWFGDFRKIGQGKNKGKYKFSTLITIGEDLTLQNLGYNDEWSKKQKYLQSNMEFIMTIDQMRELKDLLNKKLKVRTIKEEEFKDE